MENTPANLETLVHESLRTAVYENGYTDLLDWADTDIADDISDYDATFEGIDPKLIVPHVASWRALQPNPGPPPEERASQGVRIE